MMLPQDIIARKRDGLELTGADIRDLVNGITDGTMGDEQLGAMAMAIYLRGMSSHECLALTMAMRDSGVLLDWHDLALPGPVLDKHSTGGVGDATSLILGPWVAACGGFVPMISGHGLGHTGGTVDKLASIPGYQVFPDVALWRRIVADVGVAIVGQTDELAPADRRWYSVRDATATVASIPLIVASILSKKLAEGLDALVMDVKVGTGSIMPEKSHANALARVIARVAARAGLSITTLITDMNQTLSRSVGNALEVGAAIAALRGERGADRMLLLARELAAEMLLAGGLHQTHAQACRQLDQALESGLAAERFARMVAALGGPADLLEKPAAHLPRAPVRQDVLADQSGYVTAVDGRELGLCIVALGGGRQRAGQSIDTAVGLTNVAAIGDAVCAGQPLAQIHARSTSAARAVAARVRAAFSIGAAPCLAPPLVYATLHSDA